MRNLEQLIGSTVLMTDQHNDYIVTLRGGLLDKTSFLDLWMVANNTLTFVTERKKDFLFNMRHAQEHAELWIDEIIAENIQRLDDEWTLPNTQPSRT